MLRIAKWYNNYQSPAVLMIDDLSDAYIDVYKETYKNDWGYLCKSDESSYTFLKRKLLDKYPKLKITFFTPYAKHNVINENSQYKYKKYSIGKRQEFNTFLNTLVTEGHEIAHHGSNHGEYINVKKPTTANNWIHEWALFDSVEEGVCITLKGIEIFKEECNIDIFGGKYCGYVTRENSQDIIDKCNFLYWCDKPSYNVNTYDEGLFGQNNIISFPTTYAGNSFVRLTYLSGDKVRDKKKRLLKYFQPLYSLYAYFKLYKLYYNRQIISVQEHYSPSTTAGIVQSANIITDIQSLNKIFSFLKYFSIWYANCYDISKYIYIRNNSNISITGNYVNINFNNYRKLVDAIITITSTKPFTLKNKTFTFKSIKKNNLYIINLEIKNGKNEYIIIY